MQTYQFMWERELLGICQKSSPNQTETNVKEDCLQSIEYLFLKNDALVFVPSKNLSM